MEGTVQGDSKGLGPLVFAALLPMHFNYPQIKFLVLRKIASTNPAMMLWIQVFSGSLKL